MPPFVGFKMQPTLSIESTPTVIFQSDVTCLLDSVLLSSQVAVPLIASVWITREDAEGGQIACMLAQNVSLNPFERLDLLKDTTLTLEPDDLLYAASDYTGNLFNTFVSYRALYELGKDEKRWVPS